MSREWCACIYGYWDPERWEPCGECGEWTRRECATCWQIVCRDCGAKPHKVREATDA